MFLEIDFTGIIFILKIIGFILSLVFAVALVVSLLGKYMLSEKEQDVFDNHFLHQPQMALHPHQERWGRIRAHFESGNPAEWRMAIIDADAMLEDLITQMGYQGASFGEKLKAINPHEFPLLQTAWEVHKLRNILAHEGSNYHLTQRQAYQAFKNYEHIFFETGYLA